MVPDSVGSVLNSVRIPDDWAKISHCFHRRSGTRRTHKRRALATSHGTPSIVLFGPTPPERWGHRGTSHSTRRCARPTSPPRSAGGRGPGAQRPPLMRSITADVERPAGSSGCGPHRVAPENGSTVRTVPQVSTWPPVTPSISPVM